VLDNYLACAAALGLTRAELWSFRMPLIPRKVYQLFVSV